MTVCGGATVAGPGWIGKQSRRWLSFSALAVFGVAVLPLLTWYARRMTDGSDEPLGVFALIAAVAILVMAARFGRRDREGLRLHPWRMLGGALVLAALQLGGWLRFPLLVGVLAVAAVAWAVEMPRGKAGVVALLVLSLPLIASLDFFAGYPLRLVAAGFSHALLQLGGIEVGRAGVMLLDGERLVGIDPPCAGVRMLWTACLVAALLAARMRLCWLRTLALLAIAVACVVLGNGLRAALVFLPESGRVVWPDWIHPAIGLVVHGAVLASVLRLGGWLDRRGGVRHWWGCGRGISLVAVSGCLVALISGGILVSNRGQAAQSRRIASPWPALFDGRPLTPQPLSEVEAGFARAFPGQIGKFSWDDATLILRRVKSATRMMHPSGDCLRAAGYEVASEPLFRDADGRLWGASTARRVGRRWLVHERYVSVDGRAVTDASAWFWQALLHPDQGPWTAVTVIREDCGV